MKKLTLNLTLAGVLLLGASAWMATAATPEEINQLVAVLKSDAPQKEKADACRELAHKGDASAIPALAALLGDEKLAHNARYGLETIPDPAVDTALRASLDKLQGRFLVGAIGSVGVRRDIQAVGKLAGFLSDANADIAQAAARALGSIASPEAIAALKKSLPGTPAANQLAHYEGLLRAAERLAAAGQTAPASEVYQQLRASAAPHQIRAAGLRGLILLGGNQSASLVTEAVQAQDYTQTAVALRAAMELGQVPVWQALAAVLPKLVPDRQIGVISALGKGGSEVGIPALQDLAKQAEKSVRLAAIRALAEIGSPRALATLLALTTDAEREVATAAQDAVAGFPGKEADAAVRAMLSGQDAAAKIAAIELINRRRLLDCIPDVVKAAGDADAKVRVTALKRLGDLGTPAEIPTLLKLLGQTKGGQEVGAVEQSLGSICARAEKPEAATGLIVAAMKGATRDQQGALLRVLSVAGGSASLEAVRTAVNGTDQELRSEAIRALGEWRTADAAPDLLKLAQTAPTPTDKMLCLRSYLGLAAQAEITPEQKLAMCKDAMPLAQRPEEKRLLLGAIGGLNIPEAVVQITPFLADETVKEEACTAILTIADRVLQRSKAAQFAPKLMDPLTKVAGATGNADRAKRAQALLELAKKKTGK
jgi:HEAT repeat protein